MLLDEVRRTDFQLFMLFSEDGGRRTEDVSPALRLTSYQSQAKNAIQFNCYIIYVLIKLLQ